MSFSNDQQLELQTAGQASWDDGLNANFQILERGYHIKATAGVAISSGQACVMTNSSTVVPYNARSLDLLHPHFLSYKSVSSGAESQFLTRGIVRSMGIWAFNVGEPVFVSITSEGFLVNSFQGCGYAVGVAVASNAVLFAPKQFDPTPHKYTITTTLADAHLSADKTFNLGSPHRGIVTRLQVVAQSANAFKVRFWSGSSRVSSELIYETLTKSHTLGNSVDVTTLNFIDAAMFPYECTNTSSPGQIWGTIRVQSGTQADSSHFAVTLTFERFR